MKSNEVVASLTVVLFVFTSVFLMPHPVFGHCDTLNGPVVAAARTALETGNINRVLIWVQKQDEAEIQKTFQNTVAVRKLNPEAKELADMYFFETLVRIHRAGEGAPYTGLKPADTDLGPAIPCADKALETGKVEKLLTLLTSATKEGLEEHFKDVMSRKNFDVDDVAAGREYVKAYVTYTHYVERLYEAARHPVDGHYPEAEQDTGHKD